MATERIQIIVSSKGDVTVKRNIEDIGKASRKSAEGVGLLKGALTALVSGATIASVISYADANTRLQNSLKITGLEGAALGQVQDKLYDQANRNGVEVGTLAQVYSRMSLASKELGASQEDMLTVTSGVAASLRLTGLSAEAARGPMLQLSQALGNGIVRAEEWNSITEGMLPIAQAAARGMDGMGGSVAKLRQAILAGEVTSKEFFEALKVGFVDTEAQALKAQLTVSQALTVFDNQFTKFIGTLDSSTGFAGLLSNALIMVAFNLDTVLLALTPLAAALTVLAVQTVGTLLIQAFAGATAALGSLVTMFGRFALLIAANPIVAIGIAVAAVIAYFVDWEKVIQSLVAWFGRLQSAIGAITGDKAMLDKGIQITVNADQAAAQLTTKAAEIKNSLVTGIGTLPPAMDSGGQKAANDIKNGMTQGGTTAAGLIARGVANAAVSTADLIADGQQRAILAFEKANGIAAKKMSESIVKSSATGAEYMYNSITGAVSLIPAKIEQGAATGAGSLEQGVISGAKSGGTQIFNSIESAFATLAPLGEVFSAFNREFRANIANLHAETALMEAERMKILAEIDAINKESRYGRRDRSGNGNGNGGGGWVNAPPRRNQVNEQTPDQQNDAPKQVTPNAPNITNVISPSSILEVMQTAAGQKVFFNYIRMNRAEVLDILGIV